MYKLISPTSQDDFPLLASMHNLRFRMFKERMGWPRGDGISRMEFDEYDTDKAVYLVKVDPSDNQVCATTRLISTVHPYLLGNSFRQFVAHDIPKDSTTWETTRFVADQDKPVPSNITGELIAAMLEFGVKIGIRNYVSLSDVRIEKLLLRAGWDPTPMGDYGKTDNGDCVAFIYTVHEDMLQNVRKRSKISGDLITNLDEFVEKYALEFTQPVKTVRKQASNDHTLG